MGKPITGNFYGTVLFVDIKNFLNISEILKPEDIRKFILKAIDPMSKCIKEKNGYICQIQGDAILAIFGLDKGSNRNHAKDAIDCGLEIQKTLNKLNPIVIGRLCIPIKTSIGICSGNMYACHINVEGHKEFTVLGRTVNLASRYQKLNKHYGTNILIDETVFAYIKGQIATRKMDNVCIDGCSTPVNLYEVIIVDNVRNKEKAWRKRQYEKGLVYYLREEWDKAMEKFQRVSEDNVYYKMLKRCKGARTAQHISDDESEN
jgi:class 3 adenylate cyclase